MKNYAHADLPATGQKVKIKPEVLPHLIIREWIVDRHLSNGKILLKRPDRNYTLEVNPDDLERCSP